MSRYDREYSDREPSLKDVFWSERHGKGTYTYGWSGTSGGGRQFGFSFEDGHHDYYSLWQLDWLYDSRIRVRDLVDVRRDNGIVLRGTVVEIKPDEERPYCISGNGALVWMAAHEFERFVRADAPERAYETLTAVRARIETLEAELTALKLTEEVLEGVYV